MYIDYMDREKKAFRLELESSSLMTVSQLLAKNSLEEPAMVAWGKKFYEPTRLWAIRCAGETLRACSREESGESEGCWQNLEELSQAKV